MFCEVDRRDDGDVRQVRSAVIRVVEHIHIAGLHGASVLANHGFDAFPHRAKMHRHVWRVGDQVAVGVKQGTAKVQSLLDIDRVSGVLQLQAHLLGDVHEQVVEYFQQDRVNLGTCCKFNSTLCPSIEDQVIQIR